jgi:pseudouridine synthase
MRIFKYWKPIGAVSSFNPLEPYNIFNSGKLKTENLRILQEISSSSSSSLTTVGRLDKDSSGLLLLCDDTEIVLRLTRTYNSNISREGLTEEEKNEFYGSKYEKIYHITTENYVSDELLYRLRIGVHIITKGRRVGAEKSNRKTLPCKIERVLENVTMQNQIKPKKKTTDLYIALREGRNRQIRKMIGSVGHSVQTLCRLSFGKVTLDGLKEPGDMLPLSEEEKKSLDIV